MVVSNDTSITSSNRKTVAAQRATGWVPLESSAYCEGVYFAYRSENFSKQCDTGVGSNVPYIKAYFSDNSQEEANDLAENDTSFEMEGQIYANQNGICVVSGKVFDSTYSQTYN